MSTTARTTTKATAAIARLDSRGAGQGGGYADSGQYNQGGAAGAGAPGKASPADSAAPQADPGGASEGFGNFDDDIPF